MSEHLTPFDRAVKREADRVRGELKGAVEASTVEASTSSRPKSRPRTRSSARAAREAQAERVNDGAAAGVVVAKRRGVSDPAAQVVFMTLADFAALVAAQDVA